MKRNIEGDNVELKSVNLRCEGRCSARHVRVPQEEILRFEYHAMTLSDFEVEPGKKKKILRRHACSESLLPFYASDKEYLYRKLYIKVFLF